MKIDLNKIAEIFIKAFDMDMQLFLKNVNKKLAQTSGGQSIVEWAKNNPQKFNALLHMISIAIQQIPNANGILINIIKNQLVRLPAGILEIVDEDVRTPSPDIQSSNDIEPLIDEQNLSDAEFALSMSVDSLRDFKKRNIKMSLNEYLLYAPGEYQKLLPFFSGREDETIAIDWYRRHHPDWSEKKVNEMHGKWENFMKTMPNKLLFEAIELTKIHSEILKNIEGKTDAEALEIFKSEYTTRIFDSIKRTNSNENLDSETKKLRIDSWRRLYGKFLDSIDQFSTH